MYERRREKRGRAREVGRVPRFLNCLLLSLVTARQNARFSKKEEETEREGGRAKKKKHALITIIATPML
jgi:hypothetical protein